jgi:Kef-type K+ transport system membrane component KefB
MPLFFALAGLGTTPSAFSGGRLGPMILIVAAATLGKILGGAAGARLAKYSWRESWATGSLMNARGLMELIIIKIGMDAGVIGPGIFTMLLVMALATTAMTGPLLSLVLGRRAVGEKSGIESHTA